MQEFCAKSLFLGVKFLYMGCIMRQKCTYASKVRKIYKKIIDLSLVFRVQRTLRYCLVNGFAFLGKDKIAFVKESNRHIIACDSVVSWKKTYPKSTPNISVTCAARSATRDGSEAPFSSATRIVFGVIDKQKIGRFLRFWQYTTSLYHMKLCVDG